METKINLIEILKDMPLNLKLYDAVRNIDVFLEALFENINKIRCKLDEDGWHMIYYSHKGTLVDYEDGIVALVPSKEMQDWTKFAWKKGDILVNKDADVYIIFDGFEDDTYKTFYGQYYLWEEDGSIMNIEEIKPIPLTPSILEKNGWKIEDVNPHDFSNIVSNGVMYRAIKDKEILFFQKGASVFTCPLNYRKIEIRYVHELQHILFGLGLNSEMEVYE